MRQYFPFGINVIEIPAGDVHHHAFDVILYQTDQNYLYDQYEILSAEQRKLPRIFLKHDPPFGHPTDSKPVVDDPDVFIVHVTHFNVLMWNNEGFQTRVITHGVMDTGHAWTGELEKGIVVINNLPTRGRLLGLDLFYRVRAKVPVDIVGID